MREFFLLPLFIVAVPVLLGLAVLAFVPLTMLAWIGEKQGWLKLGGIHRDTDDIGWR